MIKEKIEVGDIVQLKTSGPDMVVDFDYGDGTVRTVWFYLMSRRESVFTKLTLKIMKKHYD